MSSSIQELYVCANASRRIRVPLTTYAWNIWFPKWWLYGDNAFDEGKMGNCILGGLQSIQRVESINRCMKDFFGRNDLKLFKCIPQLDKVVIQQKHKCVMGDFKVKTSTRDPITQLCDLEEHAATIYTEGVIWKGSDID